MQCDDKKITKIRSEGCENELSDEQALCLSLLWARLAATTHLSVDKL